MIGDAVRNIPDFPEKLANELKHCIVAHHGELEYGSPTVSYTHLDVYKRQDIQWSDIILPIR